MANLHPNFAFDTLAFVKSLTDKGYDREMAEALAEAQRDFFSQNLATKETVQNAALTTEAAFRQEITKTEGKLEQKIVETESKLRQEIEKVHYEVVASENRMMKSNAKMAAFAVGVLLAAPPLIQAIFQRLG